jgi:hypothetical protein
VLYKNHEGHNSYKGQFALEFKDNLPLSFYEAQKLVEKLGLEVKTINCCVNGCMLFYDNEFGKNDGALVACKFCNAPRYEVCDDADSRKQKQVSVKSMVYLPIIPRLQRFYHIVIYLMYLFNFSYHLLSI